MENKKNSCSPITFGISPLDDNYLSSREKNITDSDYLPGTNLHFPFLWNLAFTFTLAFRLFSHKSTSVLWWTASPPAGTVSTGLMASFTRSSHTRTKQTLSSEIRQLGPRGQLCHHIHFRYCFPSQPKGELSKKHKAIIQVQTQPNIFGSTDHFRTLQAHLGLTLMFMFSDSSLKYKACLVY